MRVLLLQIRRPSDQVLPDRHQNEQNDDHLRQPHLPIVPIVVHGGAPVRQPVDEHVIVMLPLVRIPENLVDGHEVPKLDVGVRRVVLVRVQHERQIAEGPFYLKTIRMYIFRNRK